MGLNHEPLPYQVVLAKHSTWAPARQTAFACPVGDRGSPFRSAGSGTHVARPPAASWPPKPSTDADWQCGGTFSALQPLGRSIMSEHRTP
jgi:hypothetical protein